MGVWVWKDAQVTRVVDGDTLEARLRIDVGFYGTFERVQRLRLTGINTPPLHTPEGKAAKEFVEGWLPRAGVEITTYKPYKYGDEWMAEVRRADKRILTADLVHANLAQPWSGQGARPGG